MAQEPASIRTKNPGAMWGSPLAIKWGAHKTAVVLNDGLGQGNNIAVFDSYVAGICAQLDLWRTSKNYRNKRFADAIATWSGGNASRATSSSSASACRA
jgi:cystathionine beta-lyase/cystathionine gamma-synthase